MCRMECLFSSQLAPVPIYCLVNRGTCVNNLPKVEREAPWPGIEPATSRLQVRSPNHYATMPHIKLLYINEIGLITKIIGIIEVTPSKQ